MAFSITKKGENKKMKNFAIESHDGQNCHYIFHATPDNPNCTWQWYIAESKDDNGTPIEGERYESLVLTDECITQCNYNDQYLYCEYKNLITGTIKKTEPVLLNTNVDEMIKNGVAFDNIDRYDKNGMIENLKEYRVKADLRVRLDDYDSKDEAINSMKRIVEEAFKEERIRLIDIDEEEAMSGKLICLLFDVYIRAKTSEKAGHDFIQRLWNRDVFYKVYEDYAFIEEFNGSSPQSKTKTTS